MQVICSATDAVLITQVLAGTLAVLTGIILSGMFPKSKAIAKIQAHFNK